MNLANHLTDNGFTEDGDSKYLINDILKQLQAKHDLTELYGCKSKSHIKVMAIGQLKEAGIKVHGEGPKAYIKGAFVIDVDTDDEEWLDPNTATEADYAVPQDWEDDWETVPTESNNKAEPKLIKAEPIADGTAEGIMVNIANELCQHLYKFDGKVFHIYMNNARATDMRRYISDCEYRGLERAKGWTKYQEDMKQDYAEWERVVSEVSGAEFKVFDKDSRLQGMVFYPPLKDGGYRPPSKPLRAAVDSDGSLI